MRRESFGVQRKVNYNSYVQTLMEFPRKAGLLATLLLIAAGVAAWAQQAAQTPQAPPAPVASGARILLLPRKIVTGERATLAVLDVNGRLTPGVTVAFSNGDKFTTNATGRAMFVAPLLVFASLVIHHPIDFVFTGFEIGIIALATLIVTGEVLCARRLTAAVLLPVNTISERSLAFISVAAESRAAS